MRWIYLAVIILITAAIIFALQNFEIVTMSLLGFNVRVPLALFAQLMSVAGARADLVRAWRDVSF
jgi:putative membrane protein